MLTAGCATITPRNVLPQASAAQIELEGFRNIRFWGDAPARDIQAIMMADTPRAEMRSLSGAEKHPPVSNLLAISGGAEDGAFGAGLLVGWSDAGTRPSFDLVTGVSSGALIAPFAFLGRGFDGQLREIFTKYGRQDIFTYNVPGLLEGSALADDAPLARLMRDMSTMPFAGYRQRAGQGPRSADRYHQPRYAAAGDVGHGSYRDEP